MTNAHIHIMLSTIFSMIITFALHYALHQTRVDSSIVQQYMFDVMRDYMITIRCWFYGRNEFITCARILIGPKNWMQQVNTVFMCVTTLSVLLYGLQAWNRLRPVIQTIMIVWLLARFCEGNYLYYEVDIITVYFLIWQCTYIMCKWEDHEFSFPFLILQQGSLCISAALLTFLLYDYAFRFFPIQVNFALLWLWSLYDVIGCFYINGCFRKIFLNTSYKYSPPGLYYTFDFEDIVINENNSTDDNVNNDKTTFNDSVIDNDGIVLGYGDFMAFNLMPLLIIDPLWPITTKLYVFIGCIVSIQIGHCVTGIIPLRWLDSGIPVLPFVVTTFSTYAVFIYHFMYDTALEDTNAQYCT